MPSRNYQGTELTPVLEISEEEKHNASLVLTGTAITVGASNEDLNNVLMALGLKDYPEESSG